MIEISEIFDAIYDDDIDFLTNNKSEINWNATSDEEDGNSLILYALSFKKNEEICNLIIENGGNIHFINSLGENAVHSIVFSGEVEKINKYAIRYNVDINQKDEEGTCPLLLSILLGKVDVALALLACSNIDVNNCDNENNSPLHMAAMLGHYEVVVKLIDMNANLFNKTNKGNIPIALAFNRGHFDIAKLLYAKMDI